MLNNNLHLFLKIPKDGMLGKNGKESVEEHIEVFEKKGSVIWGYSSSGKIKSLSEENINVFKLQIKSGEESFVIFCDATAELLHIGRFVEYWSWNDFNKTSKEMKFIPNYYHQRVGIYDDGEARCIWYIKVTDIRAYPFSYKDYIFLKGYKVMEKKGQGSFFYVKLKETFYNKLKKDYSVLNEVNKMIDGTEKENAEVELEIKKIKEMQDFQNIEETPKPVTEKFITTYKTKIKRNKKTLANAIVAAHYKCEHDLMHKTFISKITEENYVEGHHFIPLEYQDDFENSLDVESNIISLCPNCHRLLHYGTLNEKEIILAKLYNERKERLEKTGIGITFDQLLNYYK